MQQRHHEVPPALALRYIDLELEIEPPEGNGAFAVADEVVERRQQRCPRLERPQLDLVKERQIVRVDVPVALEAELHRNDAPIGFELLPDAGEALVTVPDEMPLHLKRRGDAERAQGADRGLAQGDRALRDLAEGDTEPAVREGPAPPATHPARRDDPALKPEEGQRVGDRAAGAPPGFVLLGVFLEVGGAHRAIGREALENELAEPCSRRHP